MARNIKTEVKGNLLVITVDISSKVKADAPLSTSGKNKLLASSEGNMDIGEGVKLGLNVFCPPPR